jgi:4-amino-4-deoxy-L-arabinose transferase-like glycosyltransferase
MPSATTILTARGTIESQPVAVVPERRSIATSRTLLLTICAIAFALRVAAIVGLHAWDNPGAMEHDAIAKFLVAGQGFTFSDWGLVQPTSVQSPLMPGILAIAFLIFGSGTATAYASVMVLNAALGALSCAATFAMTRAVGGTVRVALIAAALVAIWPTQIYASTFVQAIAFITAATCAIVWLWNRGIDTGGTAAWMGYGLIGCLAALTEPVLLPFMALSGLLILVWRGVPFPSRFRGAVLLFLCAMVVLAPWAWRNYNIHGAMVPVKSTFWVNVWKGNNTYATGTDRLPLTDEQRAALAHDLRDDELRGSDLDLRRQYDELTPEQKMELWEKPEVEREPIFGRYAKDFIRENPGTYAKLCGIRLWKTLWVEADNPKSHGVKQYVLYWLPRSVLLTITPIGLWMAWRRRWRLTVPLLIVGTAIATYTLTIAAARFALPYEPMQLALLALVLSSAYDRLTGRRDCVAEVAK